MDQVYYFNKSKNKKNTWTVDISGYHTNLIRNYLENDDISTSGIQNIILNASKILGYCPNPSATIPCKKTGIVIGKVQSGKTSNFITTISLAFDNGYSLVVVLGGTKINLVKQNKERIEDYFKNDESVVIFDTETNANQLNENTIKNFIINNKKVIIVSLKSANKINKMNNSIFKNSYFSTKPLLIFDDEGDEYTPNTLVKKNKKSSTYKAITDMLDSLSICAFISVTATPQANLIMSTIDILSPDFGILVYPGEGYCGLDVFHSDDSLYCIRIPEDEDSLLDDFGVPSSYYDALSMYFVASAIYSLREPKNKKFSMMVHPSWVVKDLTNVYEKTMKIKNNWVSLIENKNDIGFHNLETHLKKAYNTYLADGVEVGKFEDVLEKALNIISFCGVHLITGNNQLEDNDKYYNNNIYIGGQMVGRGLTIKGLAITYIIRSAKGISNVDTVQQRARWFGYKESILDLCRIFATEKIISDFSDIRIHEEEMWQLIENNNSNGTNFKDMKRLFLLGKKLRMTRTSVGNTKEYSFNMWNIERKFQSNPKIREYNMEIMESIYQKYKKFIKRDYIGEETYHEVVSNIVFSKFITEDLCNYISPEESTCSIDFVSMLSKLLDKFIPNTMCEIIWMRHRSDSKHIIDSNNNIPNYMVGRRPSNVPESQCTYLGDLKYYKDNIITIQIHYITNKNNLEEKCPTLAIYVPSSISTKLKNIVVPE